MQELIFGVAGGLALFIYGMNIMGDGLKKVAGERMRKILEAVTKNPIFGILVGTVVTALIQSSSATTVMVVGFVNARLMTLPQAIGVIMGANIGTTITAQLIAFNIGHYAYPIAALGFILHFFGRRRQLKNVGLVILGFGILFIGLNTMSDVLKPLAGSEVFKNWIASVSDLPILGVLIGAVMTVVVQSSSATIAVLQTLAAEPLTAGGTVRALISLPAAMPILLGSNIGTTITAFLAGIGANRTAKRAALSHTLFNIFGTFVCLLVLSYFISLVFMISPNANPAAGVTEAVVVKRQIANAHTLFNILNTLFWLPLVGFLAWAVQKIIPGEDKVIERGVKYLDHHVLGNAEVALDLANKELVRMGGIAQLMLTDVEKTLAPLTQPPRLSPVEEGEQILDELQDEIIHYLSTIVSRNTLTETQSTHLTNLIHTTGDIERIGDHCTNIGELAQYKFHEKLVFSDQAYEELRRIFSLSAEMFELVLRGLAEEDYSAARRVLELEKTMDLLERESRQRHLERLNVGTCNPKNAVCFTEIMKNLERIADHCNNVAEAVLDSERRRREE